MRKPASDTVSVCLEREVAFYDVDAYRIVWHGNYAKYFEEARCALLEKIGYSYERMEESGFFFPVIDLHIRYPRTLKFKQQILISAYLKEWRNKLVIDYLIHDARSREKLTRGQTTQVAVLMPGEITQFESPAQLIESVERAIHAEKDSNAP